MFTGNWSFQTSQDFTWRFSLEAKHEFLFNCRMSQLLQRKVMKEINCDVLGSTSHRYFNPPSCWQHITIWKQGGLSRRTATSSWKKCLFSKWCPFLHHLSETCGDGRTLVALPCVIRCSIFSNYYASALTSLGCELTLLCHLLAGCSWGWAVGGGVLGAAELQLHDSAQGLRPLSTWQPGGGLEEFHLHIQLCWNNRTKRHRAAVTVTGAFQALVYAKWELVSLLRFLLGLVAAVSALCALCDRHEGTDPLSHRLLDNTPFSRWLLCDNFSREELRLDRCSIISEKKKKEEAIMCLYLAQRTLEGEVKGSR